MAGELIRIFSDVHYGDRSSRVTQLAQLRPLLEGVSRLVLNGDTLDTRAGPDPAYTDECRAAVMNFFPRQVAELTFLTGNHDADFSPHHSLDLAAGKVLALHGDLVFEEIVPWGRDAAMIRQRLQAELQAAAHDAEINLEQRLAIWRRVAASVPQRHQSERRALRYVLHLAADTIWPPTRIWQIVRAWQVAPPRTAALTRRYRPKAKFVIVGHTHRPGIWPMPNGVTVINTGSFSPPFGGCVVDLAADTLTVRRVVRRTGEFRVGSTLATFPLAAR